MTFENLYGTLLSVAGVTKSRYCGKSKSPPITQKPTLLGTPVIFVQAVRSKECDKRIFLKEKADEKVDTYLFCTVAILLVGSVCRVMA